MSWHRRHSAGQNRDPDGWCQRHTATERVANRVPAQSYVGIQHNYRCENRCRMSLCDSWPHRPRRRGQSSRASDNRAGQSGPCYAGTIPYAVGCRCNCCITMLPTHMLLDSATAASQNWGPGASVASTHGEESEGIQGPTKLPTRLPNKRWSDIKRCTAVLSGSTVSTTTFQLMQKRGPGAIDGSMLRSEHGVKQGPTNEIGQSRDKPSVDIERCTAVSTHSGGGS